jgi:protein-tyrosine phosphatase
MSGYVDLHCHWIAGIDDGVKTPEDGLALLRGLKGLGFATVVATPHTRPAMFATERAQLEAAYAAMQVHIKAQPDGVLPEVALGSEHFFDEIVFARMMQGDCLPYPPLSGKMPKRRSILVEFPEYFPAKVADRFADLMQRGLRPVLAHPERYRTVWKDDTSLDPLLETGCALLLDVCALVGKYGSASERAAHKLLEEEAYEAACTDAHRPEDIAVVERALQRLESLVGKAECERLFREGPLGIVG